MEALDIWTVADLMKAAEELLVPLYNDRLGLLKTTEPGRGRLVYDPVSGPVGAMSRKKR